MLDLFFGSYFAQLSPCGYSDLSLLIQSDSNCLSFYSMAAFVSFGFGLTTWRICTLMLSVPAQSPLRKCSCMTFDWCLFLTAVRCFAILILIVWAVWPTYWHPQCLHWIKYTTLFVLQLAVPCVLYVLRDILLLAVCECISLECSGHR